VAREVIDSVRQLGPAKRFDSPCPYLKQPGLRGIWHPFSLLALPVMPGTERLRSPVCSPAKERLQRFIHQNGCFSMQDCQTVFGYGRSQAVAVLEYLDTIGFTIRQGNIRILRE